MDKMIKEHPIKYLVNLETIKDIFLELEDTSKFDIDVRCHNTSSELVKFYEMEIEDTKWYKAVEKVCEVIAQKVVVVINVNKEYLKKINNNVGRTTYVYDYINSSKKSNDILNHDEDLNGVLDRLFDYIGKDNIYLHKNSSGLDRNSESFIMNGGTYLTSPVLAMYFDSYEVEQLKK